MMKRLDNLILSGKGFAKKVVNNIETGVNNFKICIKTINEKSGKVTYTFDNEWPEGHADDEDTMKRKTMFLRIISLEIEKKEIIEVGQKMVIYTKKITSFMVRNRTFLFVSIISVVFLSKTGKVNAQENPEVDRKEFKVLMKELFYASLIKDSFNALSFIKNKHLSWSYLGGLQCSTPTSIIFGGIAIVKIGIGLLAIASQAAQERYPTYSIYRRSKYFLNAVYGSLTTLEFSNKFDLMHLGSAAHKEEILNTWSCLMKLKKIKPGGRNERILNRQLDLFFQQFLMDHVYHSTFEE